ncbi:ADP-ribose pyrophosphatase [Desulfofundulus luciae]|uniref:ADP-ribose pyrophosphatase n=1 Tax=Desulfofundulus luciae TaxID=74702 RepID=A0ABU0B4R8_9FIRM|nr:NUDIX hydrolase [Desulfofundulus luciae]MDQ0287711.1 ADP-ribose pyrophosphatase [Desulfofundulus luciae]
MSALIEKKLDSRVVYRGKILNLRVDTVLLPDGRTGTREVVEYAGAVAIVALNEKKEVFLVRQYRYPVGKELLEIPAGKIENGEEPLQCAQRELAEETGLRAKRWQPLCSFYSTPGFTSEKMHLFLARDLSQEGRHPDEDEFVQVVKVSLDEALAMLWRGEICDAKSTVGLLTTYYLLAREKV